MLSLFELKITNAKMLHLLKKKINQNYNWKFWVLFLLHAPFPFHCVKIQTMITKLVLSIFFFRESFICAHVTLTFVSL